MPEPAQTSPHDSLESDDLFSKFSMARPQDDEGDEWTLLAQAQAQAKPKPKPKPVQKPKPEPQTRPALRPEAQSPVSSARSTERTTKRKTKLRVMKASPKSRPQLFNKPILKSLIKMVSPQKSRATSPKLKQRVITALGFPRVKSQRKRLGTSLTARSPSARAK